jgi:hypothetical protein
MGNINLSSVNPAFSAKQVQATPLIDKGSLPPAELSKQVTSAECLAPKDQIQLAKQVSGSSQAALSFLDGETPDLPTAKEFLKLMQEVEQANELTLHGPAPGQRNSLDDSITQGKAELEKLRQAANQEPSSPEASKMLWLLEEHNKVSQGYEYDYPNQTLDYVHALEDTLKNAGIDPKPAKGSQLSAAESRLMYETVKKQQSDQHAERLGALLKP